MPMLRDQLVSLISSQPFWMFPRDDSEKNLKVYKLETEFKPHKAHKMFLWSSCCLMRSEIQGKKTFGCASSKRIENYNRRNKCWICPHTIARIFRKIRSIGLKCDLFSLSQLCERLFRMQFRCKLNIFPWQFLAAKSKGILNLWLCSIKFVLFNCIYGSWKVKIANFNI